MITSGGTRRAFEHAGVGLAALLFSASALAKDFKSGEFETTNRYGFGAFEARVRAAKGPGVISTFFLWKPGSELAPAVPWEEIDFELGPAGGAYQTQIMTPGASPPLFRTEHVAYFGLPSAPWDAYYTYRMEWTPSYIAFFRDGQEVRRETDRQEFAALFATDENGDVPINQRMEVRTGVWPGLPNIAGWSGVFDASSLPTAHFVDYVKVWAYTPNQSNKFATLLLDDEFNTLDSSNWYPAQWTFDFSASDYVSQNIGVLDGRLVVALTTNAGQGVLPNPPPDVPPVAPPPFNGFVIEAEDYHAFSDTTPGNAGDAVCSATDVDAQLTLDSKGGRCNVGWTAPGEWLAYEVEVPADHEYDLTVRLSSIATNTALHVEVDGFDVSGPIAGSGLGWQIFSDGVVPGVLLSTGLHEIRLVFDTGDMNVNYLAFELASGGACQLSCDDGNPCTTDGCDPVAGCQFQNNTAACTDDGNVCTSDVCAAGACTHPNNTAACTDDGNACTSDVCGAGACTHPANGTCSAGTTPCSGLCSNPITFSSTSFNSGNLGTGATCYQTTAALNGGVCGNLATGRKLTVNGVQMSCTGNWPNPLPAKRNAGYCVQTNAGDFAWAHFVTF